MSETHGNSTETAPKMCRRPGCDRKLGSGNTIGLCARHVRWTPPVERSSSAGNGHAAAAGKGVIARANGKSDTGNGHAIEADQAASTPKNGSNGAAELAGDFLEERLDRLLLNLPAADKSRICQQWLRGEI